MTLKLGVEFSRPMANRRLEAEAAKQVAERLRKLGLNDKNLI